MNELLYNFTFLDKLNIEINSLKIVDDWIWSEGWGETLDNDFIIHQKTKHRIIYTFSPEIKNATDDSLFSHAMIRRSYACFTGEIGLIYPTEINIAIDEYINITFRSNFPLYISSIGLIQKNKSYTTKIDLNRLKSLLFVFTKKVINTTSNLKPNIVVTYYPKSETFFSLNNIIIDIRKFLARCYSFFGIDEKNQNFVFVINYVGFLQRGTSSGYGGNGNYGGFNYLVVDKDPGKDKIRKIKLYLLHEMFHHFNKSADYKSNWFSEGFTEFFCRFFSMKPQSFVLEANKFILNYMKNPYKNMQCNKMTKELFWSNKFIEKLPYQKGFVYALWLYQKFNTKFLDCYKEIIKNSFDGKISNTNSTLKKYFSRLGNSSFQQYINLGDTIKIRGKKHVAIRSPQLDFDLQISIKLHAITRLREIVNHIMLA